MHILAVFVAVLACFPICANADIETFRSENNYAVYRHLTHFYKYFNDGQGANYESAEYFCSHNGGYLLKLNSETEYLAVRDYLYSTNIVFPNDRTGLAYVGLQWDDGGVCNTSDQCQWTLSWSDEGTDYDTWSGWQEYVLFDHQVTDSNAPNTNVLMTKYETGRWFSMHSDLKFPFICEFETACLSALAQCNHVGQCTTANNVDITCTCLSHYSGEFCEIAENPCTSNPCAGRGTCSQVPGRYEYTCDCRGTGYTGKTFTGHYSILLAIMATV